MKKDHKTNGKYLLRKRTTVLLSAISLAAVCLAATSCSLLPNKNKHENLQEDNNVAGFLFHFDQREETRRLVKFKNKNELPVSVTWFYPDEETKKAMKAAADQAARESEAAAEKAANESISETFTENITEASTEAVTESVTEGATEDIYETAGFSGMSALESARESVFEMAGENYLEATTESFSEANGEIVFESATESAAEAAWESISEAATEDVAETARESISEAATEDVAETATVSADEAVTGAAGEAAMESITEAATEEPIPGLFKSTDSAMIIDIYNALNNVIVVGSGNNTITDVQYYITFTLPDESTCTYEFISENTIRLSDHNYTIESDGNLWKILRQ